MIALQRIVVTASILVCAGCASTLSGVGGSDHYACKAPQGVQCTSVAGVYANSVANNLPAQRATPAPLKTPEDTLLPPVVAAGSTAPVRTPARVLRLWIAPWEDQDGDLYEPSYVHIVVDQGRWLIEHERPDPRALEAPIQAPLPPKDTGTSRAPAPTPVETPASGPPMSIEP